MTAQAASADFFDAVYVAPLPLEIVTLSMTPGSDASPDLAMRPAGKRFAGILGMVLVAHAALFALDFGTWDAPGAAQRMAVRLMSVAASEQPAPTALTERTARTERPAPAVVPSAAAAAAATAAEFEAAPTPAAANNTVVEDTTPPAAQTASSDTVTEAKVDTAYLDNPRPAYPPMSRRLGEEGTVILRVVVEADGRVASVEVETGCGHERLDAAARAAVRQWRFIAARQDGVAVTSTVRVPVTFALAGRR